MDRHASVADSDAALTKTADLMSSRSGMCPVALGGSDSTSCGSLYHWLGETQMRSYTLSFSELVLFFHRGGEDEIMISGDGDWLDERSTPGGIIFAPPGSSAAFAAANRGIPSKRTVSKIDTLTLHLDLNRCLKYLKGVLTPGDIEGLRVGYIADDPFLNSCIGELELETKLSGQGWNFYCDHLATAMLMHLLRRHSDQDSLSRINGGLPLHLYRKITAFIDQQLEFEIPLDTLAEMAGMSRFHFLRMFQLSSGMSPHKYVVARRIDKAEELLLQSNLPISQIAQACGFSCQSHFTSTYKKHTGSSPAQYRKIGRNKLLGHREP